MGQSQSNTRHLAWQREEEGEVCRGCCRGDNWEPCAARPSGQCSAALLPGPKQAATETASLCLADCCTQKLLRSCALDAGQTWLWRESREEHGADALCSGGKANGAQGAVCRPGRLSTGWERTAGACASSKVGEHALGLCRRPTSARAQRRQPAVGQQLPGQPGTGWGSAHKLPGERSPFQMMGRMMQAAE